MCIVVCCSVLQCVAVCGIRCLYMYTDAIEVCRSVLWQCVAVCRRYFSVLQYAQCVAVCSPQMYTDATEASRKQSPSLCNMLNTL